MPIYKLENETNFYPGTTREVAEKHFWMKEACMTN